MPPKPTTHRICADCPTDISERHGNAKRCRPCAKEHRRKLQYAHSQLPESKAVRRTYDRERQHTPARIQASREYGRRKMRTAAGREKHRINTARYRKTEKGRMSVAKYKTSAKGKETNRRSRQRRRARQYNQSGQVSANILPLRISEQSGRCYWCGLKFTHKLRKPTIDHVIPLAKGGIDEDTNLVAACSLCNFSKQDKDPKEYAHSKGRLF